MVSGISFITRRYSSCFAPRSPGCSVSRSLRGVRGGEFGALPACRPSHSGRAGPADPVAAARLPPGVVDDRTGTELVSHGGVAWRGDLARRPPADHRRPSIRSALLQAAFRAARSGRAGCRAVLARPRGGFRLRRIAERGVSSFVRLADMARFSSCRSDVGECLRYRAHSVWRLCHPIRRGNAAWRNPGRRRRLAGRRVSRRGRLCRVCLASQPAAADPRREPHLCNPRRGAYGALLRSRPGRSSLFRRRSASAPVDRSVPRGRSS